MLTMGNHARIKSYISFFNNAEYQSILFFGKDSQLETFGRVLEFLLCYERHIMVPGDHIWNANADTDSVRKCEMELERKTAIMMSCVFWVFPKPITTEKGHYVSEATKKGKTGETNTEPDGNQDCTSSWGGQKIHLLYHIPREITNHGVMSNSDTSVGEKNHGFWAKMPAFVTSKRGTETFGYEVAKRMEEAILIQHATCKSEHSYMEESPEDIRRTDDMLIDKGTKYHITLGNVPTAVIKGDSTLKKKKYRSGCFPIPVTVLSFVNESLQYLGGMLLCTTEISLQLANGDKQVIRCNPNFNEHCSYDWVNVQSSALTLSPLNGEFASPTTPAQVACVIVGHMTNGGMSTRWDEPKIVVRPAALSSSGNGRPCRSFLMQRYEKTYVPNGQPMFALVQKQDIAGQCFCFEDFSSPFHTRADFLAEREVFFQNYIAKSHTLSEKKRFLEKDWIYAVAPKTEWPLIFNEMTLGQGDLDRGLGYRPPDKD
jgi:hypothetical protein